MASVEHLFRVELDGSLGWRSDPLGIDGVVVNQIADGVIRGEGEWDPSGGWRPFQARLSRVSRLLSLAFGKTGFL